MLHPPDRDPLADVLARLTLTPSGPAGFDADPGPGDGALFGGLVVAQAFLAATHTVDPERRPHSLHAYFLRPGRYGVPQSFRVEHIREGRSYATRHVTVHQEGETLLELAASFTRPEQGIAHQTPPPEGPGPDTAEEWAEMQARLREETGLATPLRHVNSPLETRMCEPLEIAANPDHDATQRTWFRFHGDIPDSPQLRSALLVYASDRALLSTAVRPHGLHWGRGMAASLDHSVWLHAEPKLDGWILSDSESPVARNGRALCFAGMYEGDVRVASISQEALIRYRDEG